MIPCYHLPIQDNIDLEAVAELAELAELSDDYDLDAPGTEIWGDVG